MVKRRGPGGGFNHRGQVARGRLILRSVRLAERKGKEPLGQPADNHSPIWIVNCSELREQLAIPASRTAIIKLKEAIQQLEESLLLGPATINLRLQEDLIELLPHRGFGVAVNGDALPIDPDLPLVRANGTLGDRSRTVRMAIHKKSFPPEARKMAVRP